MAALTFAARLSRPTPGCPRLALLREANFRRFWLSGLLDETGGWLLFAIQGWLLLGLTHEPRSIILFFVARNVPRLLLALPAGVVCDRIGALRVLRLARLTGAAPALLLCAGAAGGWLTVELLALSALLIATTQAFERPAARSLVYGYAPAERIVGGVALVGVASTAAALTAPLLVGPAVAIGHVAWALPLQALLAAASGAILFRNAPPVVAVDPSEAARSLGGDCWTVVRYMASAPMLIGLLVLVSSPGMVDRLLTLAMPDYAAGEGAAGLTLLLLAPATGALIGGSLLTWIGGELRRLLPLALGSSSVAVLSVGLLATTKLFILSLVLFLILGAAKAAFSVAVMSALQRRIPDHARGRLLAW